MHGDCTYKVTKKIYVFSSKMDTRGIREKKNLLIVNNILTKKLMIAFKRG